MLEQELYKFVVEHGDCCPDTIEIIHNDDFSADIALSIGGDGTFLSTAAHIGKKQIPVLGINTGRLGFLADVPVENILPALESLLSSNYDIEERTLLFVETSDHTQLDNPYALNEVSVLKQDSSSMISIHTYLNGEAIHTYQADGLLISTPTGSTAYSLSIGGPVIVPHSNTIAITPVAPHSLNVRPIVINDDWEITLDIESRSHNFLIAIDGRSETCREGSRLTIRKADYKINVVKRNSHIFFNTLRNKMMWGADGRG